MRTPATLHAALVHRRLAPGAEITTHAHLRVRAMEAPEGERPALAVMLVLDTSGSMQGEAIAQVIESSRRIAAMLEEADSLAVVGFSSDARTVSPPRAMSRAARDAVRAELGGVSAHGNTNMSGGIAHGALLFDAADPRRRVMLLLSDGQPTHGATSPAALADEVRRVRQRGVAVSTLGYGPAHNDDVMIAVADAGGGRYAFVPDPKLAAGSFARALGAQRDVVLERVELTLAPADGVEVRRVYGDLAPTFTAGGMKLALQDLSAGDELNLVVELRLRAPATPAPWTALVATLTGRGPVAREPFAQTLAVTTNLGAGDGDALDRDALVATALAQAEDARTRARALTDRGDFDGAAAVLREARQALVELPGYRKGSDDPLDDAVEALSDDIANAEKAPDEAEYQKLRKAARDYGTFAQAGTRSTSVPMHKQTPSMVGFQRQMVAAVVPDAWLVVVEGPDAGARHKLAAETDIGRGVNAGVRVNDPAASRVNTRVAFHDGGFWAVDCGSTHGTFVDGVRVERAPLRHGSVLQVGGTKLRFEGA